LVIVMSVVLMRTRHGNWTFAVGGNPGAALSQGVNVKRIKLINFVQSSFFAGLAGVILFAQRSAMNELIGQGLELTAVAAAVIGGVSLAGGAGTIMMGVPNEVFRGVVGVMVIVSVVFNTYLKR
jgi:ribose/xylose/arabinose/galactoside ABC-type transport system permease subunit